MQTTEDREFWLLLARHLRGFAETLTDATQRRQMQGVVAAIDARAKAGPGHCAQAGTDDIVSECASDHAPETNVAA